MGQLRRIRSIWVRNVGTYVWRVGPLRGTRYDTYAANWMYNMHMPVLDIWTWPRGDVPRLGLTGRDVGLLRGLNYEILTQGLIWLIEYSYHQCIPSFPEAHLQRTPCLSVLGLKQHQDGWTTGKFSRVCTSEDKSAQKRLWLVCRASVWS
jgi:hypothetical protein